MSWTIAHGDRAPIAAGTLPIKDIPQGALTEIGQITAPLAKAPAPRKLTLSLAVGGTEFHNHYDLWVYPPTVDTAPPPGVVVSRVLDEDALAVLAWGGRLVLLPKPESLAGGIPGFFASDFWCYPMFRRGDPPGTLGLLCDPEHPALADFPTEFHSNWQWFPIVMNSCALVLDDTPQTFRPVVQVIDNFDKDRNHKLGMIFEAKVGDGRLLVCTSDLPSLADKPEARQLLASLLDYAASPQFQPKGALMPGELKRVLAPKSAATD